MPFDNANSDVTRRLLSDSFNKCVSSIKDNKVAVACMVLIAYVGYLHYDCSKLVEENNALKDDNVRERGENEALKIENDALKKELKALRRSMREDAAKEIVSIKKEKTQSRPNQITMSFFASPRTMTDDSGDPDSCAFGKMSLTKSKGESE